MLKRTVLTTALVAAFGTASNSHAVDDREIAQLREEIRQMKQDYESRILTLEKRLQAAESQPAPSQATSQVASSLPTVATADTPPKPARDSANAYNPAISAILGGTYANLSRDPSTYRLQGFIPGGEEVGPGKRNFRLGESELTLSASVDPSFSGQLTFALTPDNSAEVEEAFFQTKALGEGINLKGGRFLSSVGYLNSIHAHAWDFVDLPLAYQAFLGGQYKTDGLQLRWLAPTDRFVEIGVEAGDGSNFPGTQGNKNGAGSTLLFAHVGDDIGTNSSWRTGISYLRTRASDRTYDDADNGVTNSFSGKSGIWIADAVYKWAPGGNASYTNLKLQAEYFRRKETGTLTFDTLSLSPATGDYSSAQSGWYLQGIYQFQPRWRAGARYDKLYSGNPSIGGNLTPADFPGLASYNPSRTSLMLDYSPSEFSRLRVQFNRDQSRSLETDNQIFLQYIMSLGAHGAHKY